MKFLYALPVITFYLVGCGSSTYGIYTGGGNQCAADYDPLKTIDVQKDDPGNFGQPSNKVAGFNALPAGLYQFNGAEVFFKDTTNNIMIHERVPFKRDAKNYQIPDPGLTADANKPVCVANMQLVRESAYKARAAKVALSFRVTQPGSISSVSSGDIAYNWAFAGKDHPDKTKLEIVLSLPDPTKAQKNNTSIADLQKIYNDQNFDALQVYCVGACGPNDNPKQYQIRASRTVTPDKDPNPYFVEVMSSFIVDKNQN